MAFGPGDAIVPAGRCGSGFKRRERDKMRDLLDAGEYVPVEIAYNAITKSGLLRHPRFLHFRPDIAPDDTEALGVSQFLKCNIIL